ncbi:MAG: amidohydrolase family protein [Acidobacteriota bacterium]|nr:amidohydrolase family protein [Blastocatellia bacterium]MDW8240084.1 amidohydrolase family protein [Acidobacteriota bacterium]
MPIIDIVVNLWTEEVTKNYPSKLDIFWKWVKIYEQTKAGIPLEEQLRRMDAAGIEKGLLVATTGGKPGSDEFFEKPYWLIQQVIEQHPKRFKGLIGINPYQIMTWLKKLDYCVRELGFVGAHVYPHWYGAPPDDRAYYPFYAKCAELGVPIQIQVGHSAQQFLPTVARPITLDRVAIDFPELTIIGIHIGYPWTEEMIAVAWKHPNVYIGTDAHAPRYWDPSLIRFINGRGQDKVLFGTDWPVIEFERAIKEINELELKESVKQKLLYENAVRVYRLEQWV